MTPPGPPLPRAMLRSSLAVLAARTDGCAPLVRVARRPRARALRGDIAAANDGCTSRGAWPPFRAQPAKKSVNQVLMFIPAIGNVANSEKSIAASLTLHNEPEP